jgi:lipopolysaccharide transport system permease protein
MVKLMVAEHSRRLIYLHDLLRALVGRDLKSRYKGSLLGILWSMMNPLLQLLVFHFIFRLVLRLDIPRYSSFAFSAMLAWNWFQASLLDASGSMLNGRELVKRPGFHSSDLLPLGVAYPHDLSDHGW